MRVTAWGACGATHLSSWARSRKRSTPRRCSADCAWRSGTRRRSKPSRAAESSSAGSPALAVATSSRSGQIFSELLGLSAAYLLGLDGTERFPTGRTDERGRAFFVTHVLSAVPTRRQAHVQARRLF